MFSRFGRKGRIERAARRLQEEGALPREVLGAFREDERAPAVAMAIRSMAFDDRIDEALGLVDAALELGLDTLELNLVVDDILVEAGLLDHAVSACERAACLAPSSPPVVARLAQRLVDAGRPEEALEVLEVASLDTLETKLERAYALSALEALEEAYGLLVEVVDGAEAIARGTLLGAAPMTELWERARGLRDAVHTHLYGAESVHVHDLLAGKLDGAAGVNYRIIAERCMLDVARRPEHVTLMSPERTMEALPRARELDAYALARLGEAELRLGRTASAKRRFERAADLDPLCFAAQLGLGAVLDAETYRFFSTVSALPEHVAPEGIERLVPDFAALTDRERKVVVASLRPLGRLLPRMLERGARIVLLPIDVRTVDRQEWHRDAGARFEDGRAMDALGGVADSHAMLAAARIETLLDLRSANGLVFAHELAHLAYFSVEDRAPVHALFERTLASPYLTTDYHLENDDEFFAGAYVDYLRARYGLPEHRERDEEGVVADAFRYFDALSR